MGFCSRTVVPITTQLSSLREEEEERLLLTEPALAAYIQAEVQAWLLDSISSRNDEAIVIQAAERISRAAEEAYQLASREGILSNHGALISFMSNEVKAFKLPWSSYAIFRTNPYSVAKRGVDVLHHRLYRGTYTKTMTPFGVGDAAARVAVGLSSDSSIAEEEDDDKCLVEPPPELISVDCLWTEKDQVEWNSRRFEKITMEGWRDPRRGNSGTSR
jgi:hypothetical protein